MHQSERASWQKKFAAANSGPVLLESFTSFSAHKGKNAGHAIHTDALDTVRSFYHSNRAVIISTLSINTLGSPHNQNHHTLSSDRAKEKTVRKLLINNFPYTNS